MPLFDSLREGKKKRQSMSCGQRFTSYEKIEEKPCMGVKRDGRRQPVDIKKVKKTIEVFSVKNYNKLVSNTY